MQLFRPIFSNYTKQLSEINWITFSAPQNNYLAEKNICQINYFT